MKKLTEKQIDDQIAKLQKQKENLQLSKFKPGVYITGSWDNYSSLRRIRKAIVEDGYLYWSQSEGTGGLGEDIRSHSWDLKNIRLATLKEIKEHKTPPIKVGDYKVQFQKGKILIEGNTYTKADLIKIKEILSLPKIQSLKVGCSGQFIVNKELVELILKRLGK